MKKIKVSIIIMGKNEGKIIGGVIDACKKSLIDFTKEIIAVIPLSNRDNSVEICKKKGIKVVQKDEHGKGEGMENGLKECKGDIIVYTDADIKNLTPKMIDGLVMPIINEGYDFVNGSYSNIGRVTEFAVKPLLKFTFPEISNIKQPISGQSAGRKKYFEKINFQHDWGVDIGIRIDMLMLGAKIKDVALPKKEDTGKPHITQDTFLEDIVETIIEKAKKYNRIENLKKQEIKLILKKMYKTVSALL